MLSILVSAALLVSPVQGEHKAQEVQVQACKNENGSGQRLCVWDAKHMGNGSGKSLLNIGGEDGYHFVISHRTAHRLTH